MNGDKVYEVECLDNIDPVEHSRQLAGFLCEGWEIITNGLLTVDSELVWYATVKREKKVSRLATEMDRALFEMEKTINERVTHESTALLSADDPYEREEIANQIAENTQVSALVLALFAEAIRPVMPEYLYQQPGVSVLQ